MNEITAVLEENEKLREELAALRASLSSLGSHNLKQGMMLAQMGVEPDDLARVSINKVRADAIRSVLDTPHDCETPNGDIAWSSRAIEEHANKIEGGL